MSHSTFDQIARFPSMSLPTFDGDIQKWTYGLNGHDYFCVLEHFDEGLTDVKNYIIYDLVSLERQQMLFNQFQKLGTTITLSRRAH